MPRRRGPAWLARALGRRIHALREAAGLTQERLAWACDMSKGFLSHVESGDYLPSVPALHTMARVLGVALLDLVTFPERDERQALVDRTRHMPRGTVRKLLREMGESGR